MRGLDSKGISPLIATVLLMAFAVAIGGMIMNWSSDLGETLMLGCQNVQLEAVDFCRSGKGVELWLKNVGEEDVSAIRLRSTLADGEQLDTDPSNSAVPVGESLQKTVPMVVDPDTEVAIHAFVSRQNEDHLCDEAAISSQTLSEC